MIFFRRASPSGGPNELDVRSVKLKMRELLALKDLIACFARDQSKSMRLLAHRVLPAGSEMARCVIGGWKGA